MTPQQIGPYAVLRPLGRGGMGAVYLVQDPEAPRQLALKVIGEAALLSQVAAERFKREAETLGRIRHPGVVGVHRVGEWQRGAYIVMDHVEGEDLETLSSRGALAPREAARIVRELSDALSAVHAEGILHRDIKPANVVLRADGVPVLLDFGLAWEQEAERLTRTGATLGTLAYMSPEQAGGRPTSELTPATDVYPLGVMLFELLSGEQLFEDDLVGVLIGRKLSEVPPAPSSLNPRVPPALDAICRSALERDPLRRYATAAELREELDRFLSGRAPRALRRGGRSLARLAWVAGLLLVLSGLALWRGLPSFEGAPPAPSAAPLQAKARALLAERGPLAARAARVAALSEGLSQLDHDDSPDARRLRQQVLALEGMLALARGESSRARELLAESERFEPADVTTYALRGGLAALDPAGDPREALRDLRRAKASGVEPAELVGWRVLAEVRQGLTPARAERVLEDLRRAVGERSPSELEASLEIRALVAAKRASDARAALSRLKTPPHELLWAVALAEAELQLEEDPGAALKALRSLEPPPGTDPARERIAQRARELASPLAARVEAGLVQGVRRDPTELRLFDLLRIVQRLEGAPLEDGALARGMLAALTGYSRYWRIEEVLEIEALLPDTKEFDRGVTLKCRAMNHPDERRSFVPILRRMAERQADPLARLDLEVGLCVSLSEDADQGVETRALAERLLRRTGLEPTLRADLLVARVRVALREGRTEAAWKDLQAARQLGESGRWMPGSFRIYAGEVLIALGRVEEGVREVGKLLEDAHLIRESRHVMQNAAVLLWTHGRERYPEPVERGLQGLLGSMPGDGGWWARLASLQLRRGDRAGALESMERVAVALQEGYSDLAERAREIAGGLKEGPGGDEGLREFVETLEERRGAGFAP